MLRNALLILIVQAMFCHRPEIHGKGSDLDFSDDIHHSRSHVDGILDDHMITPVSTGLHIGDVVLLIKNPHIASTTKQLHHCFNVIHKLHHDTDSCDVFQLLRKAVMGNPELVGFLQHGGNLLHTARNKLNGRIIIFSAVFCTNGPKLHFELLHCLFIGNQKCFPIFTGHETHLSHISKIHTLGFLSISFHYSKLTAKNYSFCERKDAFRMSDLGKSFTRTGTAFSKVPGTTTAFPLHMPRYPTSATFLASIRNAMAASVFFI